MEDHTQILARIAEMVTPVVPREICSTEDCVRWLVDYYDKAQKALRDLEQIRTEHLAAKGLFEEANAVSRARVKLQ